MTDENTPETTPSPESTEVPQQPVSQATEPSPNVAKQTKPSSQTKTQTRNIVLGVVAVVLLFIISAVVNTWSAVKTINSDWGPSTVFHSSKTSNEIVALDVEGVIFESQTLLEAIESIREDSKIKGVVLRINTPGGAVAPTQEILSALNRLKKKKIKIYCSLADIAASGGYYLATACSKIFTNPGTLTGSIGVIMPFANLQELYKFIKIEPVIIKAGRFKDLGSESRPMTTDERILLQNMADEIHRQFKAEVQASRKLSDEVIQEYADGRIFIGSQAKDYGFADEIGGEFEAAAALAKDLKVKEPKTLSRFPIPEPEYKSLFGILSSKLTPKSEVTMSSDAQQIIDWIGSKAPELHPSLSSGVPYFLPYSWFSKK